MKVVGVDLSTTATGIASIVDGEFIQVATLHSPAEDWGKTYDDRQSRMRAMVSKVHELAHDADLVCVEGPSYASNSSGTWDRAGLWWNVYNVLAHSGRHIAIIPPTARAKWATGNGRANKAQVVSATSRLWPDIPINDDNMADAMVLAAMGAQKLGMDICRTYSHHAEVLSRSVEWPIIL